MNIECQQKFAKYNAYTLLYIDLQHSTALEIEVVEFAYAQLLCDAFIICGKNTFRIGQMLPLLYVLLFTKCLDTYRVRVYRQRKSKTKAIET